MGDVMHALSPLSKGLLFGIGIIGLLVGAVLYGRGTPDIAPIVEAAHSGTGPSIPPIDATAPAHTRTATFALG
jgi:hypothetical protein